MKRPVPPASERPAAVDADVAAMKVGLDAALPAKDSGNLLIGTWNIRALSGLTDRWQSRKGDSPRRDWHALHCIAEVVRRIDVTAVQETRRDTTALLGLLTVLGDRYDVIISDVTEGDAGNNERLAYIYDTERVQASGLVGEVVLPPLGASVPTQFVRTPYAASFRRSDIDFTLTTVHILWGNAPKERVEELARFARWMRDWADRPKDWNTNLLVLGDFNLDRLDDPLFEAFVSTGLYPPTGLGHIPRTVFSNDKERNHYDQIAWFSNPESPGNPTLLTGLEPTGRCGSFDFLPHPYRGHTKLDVSWRISDHYPLWVEFDLD